jgi:circadian clock protein KaiB
LWVLMSSQLQIDPVTDKPQQEPPPEDAGTTAAFEAAAAAAVDHHYLLRLYTNGSTSRSNQAIVNLRKLCEEYLEGRHVLEIVDISQNPELAKDEQIIAAPTLVRMLPLPLRRFIGDLSQTERILVGLDLRGGS